MYIYIYIFYECIFLSDVNYVHGRRSFSLQGTYFYPVVTLPGTLWDIELGGMLSISAESAKLLKLLTDYLNCFGSSSFILSHSHS